jgi:hypothetical protein
MDHYVHAGILLGFIPIILALKSPSFPYVCTAVLTLAMIALACYARGRKWRAFGWAVVTKSPLIYVVGTIFGIGLAAVSVFWVRFEDEWGRALVLGLWMVGIPAIFFLDWYFFSPDAIGAQTPKSDGKGAEHGLKFWLAITTFLTMIYFGDYVKKTPSESLIDLDQRITRLESAYRDLPPLPKSKDDAVKPPELWLIYARLQRLEAQ